jgi:hypothetical protein
MAEGAAGTSRAISLLVAWLVALKQVGLDPDTQMLPWLKLLAAVTVMELVPDPEVIVIPDGIVQL